MKWMALLVICLLALAAPALAQDALPACELLISDLDGDLRTQIRSQDERVRNLVSAMDRVNSGTLTIDKVIEELVYWAVMADSAAQRGPVEYPDCLEFQTMGRAFTNLIDGAYAVAGQVILVLDGSLSDFQRENVRALLEAELEELDANVSLWQLFYADRGSTPAAGVPTATPVTRAISGPQITCPTNCTEAVAMNITAQQAAACGLDRDGDGVACYGD